MVIEENSAVLVTPNRLEYTAAFLERLSEPNKRNVIIDSVKTSEHCHELFWIIIF